MVLSDRTIKRLVEEGRIGIDPYDEALMQPSSLDVRVDRYFRVFRNSRYPFIDVKQAQEELTELVEVDGEEAFILHPGEFVLGSTLERVTLPDDLVARLEGKSSLGRLGLLIHSTAGFIDPGWDGHVTLELSNVANLPITIYPEMKIGQLSFVQLSEPAETPYGSGELGSKYQGQQGPTPSRYYRNFEPDGGWAGPFCDDGVVREPDPLLVNNWSSSYWWSYDHAARVAAEVRRAAGPREQREGRLRARLARLLRKEKGRTRRPFDPGSQRLEW